MKKINNKGFTLIELIITMMFLVIILISSQRIVSNLIQAKNNPAIAYSNQTNRILIIDAVQNDLLTNGLSYTGVVQASAFTPVKGSTNGACFPLTAPCIKFSFTSYKGNAQIIFNVKELSYKNFDGITNRWLFKGGFSNVDLNLSNGYHQFVFLDGYALLTIRIPIYNENANNNVTSNDISDDIVFTYYGKYEKL